MAAGVPRRSVLIARLRGDRGTELAGIPQQVILDELRRVILDGDAPPGTSIPVDEVAELFGVSRIPVRESLKTLIGEGLVDHRPRSGYTVAQLTLPELHEIYVLRGVLEQAAIGSAVAGATAEDDESVQRAYDDLCAAQLSSDHRGYHRESRRFHLALLEPGRTQRLLRMLESAWNLTEPARPMAQIPAEQRAALHAEHRDMLDSFLARDAVRLVAVSGEHHRHLEESIAALPQDHPVFAWSPATESAGAIEGSWSPATESAGAIEGSWSPATESAGAVEGSWSPATESAGAIEDRE